MKMATKELAEGAHSNNKDIAASVKILRHSQLEIAKFFEICYLQLKDHPVQAGKVRTTAYEARIQHGMSSGLMKQFMVTAEFVAETSIPMMKELIKDWESEIIENILMDVLEKAIGMKTETERVKDRYDHLRTKLQENISDVNTRNKEVADEQKVLTIQKQEAESMARLAEKEQKEMEDERRRKLEEIKSLQQKRDDSLAKAVPSDADDKEWNSLMNIFNPAQAALDIVKLPFNLIRQSMKTNSAIKASQQAQTAIDQEEERQNKLREQIRERQETTQQRLAETKRIDLRSASLGDINSLIEALKQLSKADEMFGHIILFWDNLAVFLKSLHNDTGAGKSFLKAEKIAKIFENTLTKAEKKWTHFGSICRAYSMQSDQEIRVVYRFLSTPVDLMDIPQRETRITALTYEIENDARQLEY